MVSIKCNGSVKIVFYLGEHAIVIAEFNAVTIEISNADEPTMASVMLLQGFWNADSLARSPFVQSLRKDQNPRGALEDLWWTGGCAAFSASGPRHVGSDFVRVEQPGRCSARTQSYVELQIKKGSTAHSERTPCFSGPGACNRGALFNPWSGRALSRTPTRPSELPEGPLSLVISAPHPTLDDFLHIHTLCAVAWTGSDYRQLFAHALALL